MVRGKGRVNDRYCHSLDEMQQRKLLLNVRTLYECGISPDLPAHFFAAARCGWLDDNFDEKVTVRPLGEITIRIGRSAIAFESSNLRHYGRSRSVLVQRGPAFGEVEGLQSDGRGARLRRVALMTAAAAAC
ncbi:hypothetical protein EVAR_65866_1 [Eumeta japonica]|uniref:Uncharacterized protein n=1 Tax=Eumeta variegata TaxID=151549 RepID=A0A4C1ZKU1_EUMVA|nr:hypothetical protein EVAR_65866_1 [Eumeta japonica]